VSGTSAMDLATREMIGKLRAEADRLDGLNFAKRVVPLFREAADLLERLQSEIADYKKFVTEMAVAGKSNLGRHL
jgi:hypothetical protein